MAAGVPNALPAPGALPILLMLFSKLRLRPPGLAGVAPLPLTVAALVVLGGAAAAVRG